MTQRKGAQRLVFYDSAFQPLTLSSEEMSSVAGVRAQAISAISRRQSAHNLQQLVFVLSLVWSCWKGGGA